MTCGAHCCARCGEFYLGDAVPPPSEMETRGTGAWTKPVDRGHHFPNPDRPRISLHESAHAVVALYFGGLIGDDGVDVTRRYAAHAYKIDGDDLGHEVAITMAGPLAEGFRYPDKTRENFRDHQFAIAAARAGEQRSCDLCRIFLHLLSDEPAASDEELVLSHNRAAGETYALVTRPDVWNAVSAVADTLAAKGTLHDQEVRDIMGGALLPGGCTEPQWRSMGIIDRAHARAALGRPGLGAKAAT